VITVSTIAELRYTRAEWAEQSARVGFVPTMGALHAGHMALVKRARLECDRVVVSIFVNPAQFGPMEDFDAYPRSMDADQTLCADADVDVVFCPTVAELYPQAIKTHVDVPTLAETLCGPWREGHFDGVCLVVTKLFNIVQPDRAYFGQKDAQQTAIIQRLVNDLNMAIEIVSCPTVREGDGLAMSSRNAYLADEHRTQASAIHRSLQAVRDAALTGQRDVRVLVELGRDVLNAAGPFRIDYYELVDATTLTPLQQVTDSTLVAVAAHLGSCRLIDNLIIEGERVIVDAHSTLRTTGG
jgi:pantoate--beta-alanine ligase